MSEGERRIAAIVFTDIVGFSALAQENEALSLELLNEHFSLLRPLISEHSGTEIKTIGDSFMIEFSSPLNAVECAIAFQRALHIRNIDEPNERKILIRIGIHLGDVQHQDGDVFGDGVNIASRIEPLAEPGGIALTRQVYDQVYNKIDWELKSLGTPQLKNITTVVEIFRVELNWDASTSHSRSKISPQKLDQRLKVGSVVAVAVIAIVAMWFLIQSMTKPSIAQWTPGETIVLAVLPFDDFSPNRESVELDLGKEFAAQLTYAVSRFKGLRVITRKSTEAIGSDETVHDAGKKLGADVIVEGTVRREGAFLSSSAQLVLVEDQSYLWSEEFEGKFADMRSIINAIARSIPKQLGLEQPEIDRVSLPESNNSEAYEKYLFGRHFWNEWTKEGWERAIEYFEQAIEIDPEFAEAYSGLADSYTLLVNKGHLNADEGRSKAIEAARTALALDESLAESHLSMGIIQWTANKDNEEAEKSLRRAIELNPSYSLAYGALAQFLLTSGEMAEGLIFTEKLVELDPLSEGTHVIAGSNYLIVRNFDQAIAEFRKQLLLAPSSMSAYLNIADALYQSGDIEGAESEFLKVVEMFPETATGHQMYGIFLRKIGRWNEALAKTELALSIEPNNSWINLNMGQTLALLGKWALAGTYFQKAYELNPTGLDNLIWYCVYLIFQEREEEAIEAALRAYEQNLESNWHISYLVQVYYYSRELGNALLYAEQGIQKYPDNIWLHLFAIRTNLILMNHDAALSALEELGSFEDQPSGARVDYELEAAMLKSISYARIGEDELARSYLDLLKNVWTFPGTAGLGKTIRVAAVYFALGENDLGFELLESAIEDSTRGHGIVYGIKIDPLFDSVRSDPRYEALLNKMGLAD